MEEGEQVEAYLAVEEVEGIVQCNKCEFWGKMTGYIEHNKDPKFIKFVCPECDTIELVRNPEAL